MASSSRSNSNSPSKENTSLAPRPSSHPRVMLDGIVRKVGDAFHRVTHTDSTPTPTDKRPKAKAAAANPSPSSEAAPSPRTRDEASSVAAKEKKNGTLPEESNEAGESKDTSDKKEPESERCAICMDDYTRPKQLNKCGHTFCTDCIDQYFNSIKPQCPCCFTIYGDIRGNQPENGTMTHIVTRHRLPGYGHCSNGTIKISYCFPDGVQDEKHPSPGQRYRGTKRDAYLPDNREGRLVLHLLERSFKLRQTFTIGQSRTTGQENVVTWNDIHHKTSYNGGTENFGYPDPTYLNRVRQELAAKGIQ